MGMVPVAKSTMRMMMIRTITQMMTIIFTFFHQNFRATFCDVVLKCSDVASKSSVLFRRWSKFSPRAKILSTFWVMIFLTPSTSLCRFLTRSFPAPPLASSMSRSTWASQSSTRRVCFHSRQPQLHFLLTPTFCPPPAHGNANEENGEQEAENEVDEEEEEGGEEEEEEEEGDGEEEDGDEDEEAEAPTGKRVAEDDEDDDVDTKKQKTDEDD